MITNSVLHVISGSPVYVLYVNNKIGESQATILRPLLLSDGRILHTDRPTSSAVGRLIEGSKYSGLPSSSRAFAQVQAL